MNTRQTPRSTSHLRSTFVILITSFLLLAGHSQVAAQADPQSMASGYFDWLLGRGNAFATVALVSPNAVLHTPEGIFHGQDGPEAFGSRMGESFSDLEFEIRSSDVAGDALVIEFQMSGVHTGSYHGMAVDCARVTVPGVAVLKTDEDGFAEQWITYDQQLVLDQIHVYSLSPENERASCEAYARIETSLTEPVADPQLSPQCLSRLECETAF